MHEILVSEEEANRCVMRDGYYAIRPMLPELYDENDQEPPVLQKELSSADRVLSLAETAELLKKHRLMIEDVQLHSGGELLK
jgi:hypothetical protein